MTTTQPTGDILTIQEVGAVAPNLTVADAFRLAFEDEAGQLRWRADDARALSAEIHAASQAERANRPAWADEGEWDDDQIVYKREMSNSLVRVDQTLKRDDDEWSFVAPASMYLPGSGGDDLDAAAARLLIADLTEAVAILGTTE